MFLDVHRLPCDSSGDAYVASFLVRASTTQRANEDLPWRRRTQRLEHGRASESVSWRASLKPPFRRFPDFKKYPNNTPAPGCLRKPDWYSFDDWVGLFITSTAHPAKIVASACFSHRKSNMLKATWTVNENERHINITLRKPFFSLTGFRHN